MVTEANAVESAHDLQGAEVVRKLMRSVSAAYAKIAQYHTYVELVDGVGCVEDEVKLEGQWFVPVVRVSLDEMIGSHLQGIVLLARAVGEYGDFCAKCFRP